MVKQITALFCSFMILAGCASNIGSNWQCPNPSNGSPCVNIAQADGQLKKRNELSKDDTQEKNPVTRDVTNDVIDSSAQAKQKAEKPEKLAVSINKENPVEQKKTDAPLDTFGPPTEAQLKNEVSNQRIAESVARIWFAPFIDRYNNRHDESIIYVVDQESAWRTQ